MASLPEFLLELPLEPADEGASALDPSLGEPDPPDASEADDEEEDFPPDAARESVL